MAYTASESQALGMLFAALKRDSVTFRQLWNYSNAHLENGLMSWKVTGFQANSSGSNANADILMTLSLMIASWNCNSSYSANADAMLAKVLLQDIASNNLPKAGSLFPETYFFASSLMPGIFHAFANWDTANKAKWNQVATSCYSLLAKNRNSTSGLFSDQMSADGMIYGSTKYGYSAAVVPFGVALDYFWYGTADATTLLGKMSNWAATLTPNNIYGQIEMNGSIPNSNESHDFFTGSLMLNFMVNPSDAVFESFAKSISQSMSDYNSYISGMTILFGATAGGLIENPSN